MKLLMLLFATLLLVPCSLKADEDTELKKEIQELRAKLKKLEQELQNVKQERDKLKAELAVEKKKTREKQKDEFETGAVWKGTRFARGMRKGQDWSLIIDERNGDKFEGQIQFTSPDGKPQQLDVSGTATESSNGRIVFKTKTVGVLQQSFRGVLKGNQISLTWEGTAVHGRRVVGTATLAR